MLSQPLRMLPVYWSSTEFSIIYCDGNQFFVRINKLISDLKANGLMHYWVSQSTDYEYLTPKSIKSGPKVISFDHVLIVFEIYIAMILLSLLIFLLELLLALLRGIIVWMRVINKILKGFDFGKFVNLIEQ